MIYEVETRPSNLDLEITGRIHEKTQIRGIMGFVLKSIDFLFWGFLFFLPVRFPSLDFSFSSSFAVKEKSQCKNQRKRGREGEGRA